MKLWPYLGALAPLLLCTGPAMAGQDPPVTIDTHVDIPLAYMHQPRFDAGKDTPLLVDLGKMERGGLNAAFFVIYVEQGPLDAKGYAMVLAEHHYDLAAEVPPQPSRASSLAVERRSRPARVKMSCGDWINPSS